MGFQERDTQRKKLYRAERCVDLVKRFESLGKVDLYLARVFSHKWFQRHHPRARMYLVEDGRGRRHAAGSSRGTTCLMWLPRHARSEKTVLHELAHGLTNLKHGHGTAWHGHEFARIYLDLVRHYAGKEAADQLRAGYKKHRVRYNPPRKGRKLTPEQREAAIARLSDARELKAAAKESDRCEVLEDMLNGFFG